MKKKENKNSSNKNLEINEEKLTQEDEIGVEIANRNKKESDEKNKERLNKFKRSADGILEERPKFIYNINLRIIAIILFIIIVVVWLIYEYGPIFGIHVKPTSTNIEDFKVELVTKDSDIYGMYNEDLFVFSNNTITAYDYNTNVTWSHTFTENFVPNISVNGKYMLVTNNSTGMIYLFRGKNEILDKKIDGTIKNAFVDENGNIAIEYSNESGYNNVLAVMDRKGNSKYDAYLSQEDLVSLKMLNNANKIIFVDALSQSSSIGIKFRMIDISKTDDIEDIVSLSNEFIYNFYVEGSKIYALLNDKIVQIDINSGDVKSLKDFDSAQMLFVSLNENYYSYLESQIDKNNYVIKNVAYNSNEISSIEVDSVPKNVITCDLVNYYIYQDHIHIYNKWGVDLGQRQTMFTPKKCVVFNNNKSIALIYTNKIYIVNI